MVTMGQSEPDAVGSIEPVIDVDLSAAWSLSCYKLGGKKVRTQMHKHRGGRRVREQRSSFNSQRAECPVKPGSKNPQKYKVETQKLK